MTVGGLGAILDTAEPVLLLGSWVQVLCGRLGLFFLASLGMQILISHCPREQLVIAGLQTPCLSRDALDAGSECGSGLLL